MAEMTVAYKGSGGICIVKVNENVYYYGDGETINAFGKSANQFLRFNPYMNYVGDENEKPDGIIFVWITDNLPKAVS